MSINTKNEHKSKLIYHASIFGLIVLTMGREVGVANFGQDT